MTAPTGQLIGGVLVLRAMGDLAGAEQLASTMPNNLTSLRDEIAACSPGDTVVISYQQYRELFPPGEPDIDARQKARTFATEAGCWFVIRPGEGVVTFVKRE
jgi:hypothetical protein